uniref:Uncharacterized protein n=1 Tax=Oryza nivara TaxID=4536 RepID=A0A0E0HCN7_ORYNI
MVRRGATTRGTSTYRRREWCALSPSWGGTAWKRISIAAVVSKVSGDKRFDLFVTEKLELEQPWRNPWANEQCPPNPGVTARFLVLHFAKDEKIKLGRSHLAQMMLTRGASTDWKQVSSGTGLYKVSDGLLSNPTPISWSSLALFPDKTPEHLASALEKKISEEISSCNYKGNIC